MPRGQYVRTQFHRDILIKRNKDPEFRKKISKALIGHECSPETRKKISDSQPNKKADKNPNWRGNKVGIGGIHLWLSKNFKKTYICTFCKELKKTGRRTEWALLKTKEYERKRGNFIELCCRCHRKYDKNKEYCINGHKMIPQNLYKMKNGKRLCKLCNKLYRERNKE